jgi:hypothetical protein
VNPHFRDILAALSAAEADFLVVGAYALGVHGLARATGDLDVWVRPTEENARKVWIALGKFGAPLAHVQVEDFFNPDVVFRMGLPPSQIDILTSITGVTFEQAWENRLEATVEGVKVFVLGMHDQIQNKQATDRPKDKLDAAWLERKQRGEA